jgi:hypothetical protein
MLSLGLVASDSIKISMIIFSIQEALCVETDFARDWASGLQGCDGLPRGLWEAGLFTVFYQYMDRCGSVLDLVAEWHPPRESRC